MKNITTTEYAELQRAYEFFNRELFDDSLPAVLITLQRKGKAYGYLSPESFTSRSNGDKAHELALNPDHFSRIDREILATLVHEMVHLRQLLFGKPPRKAYHDRQWAAMMVEIGLQPSHTGEPGGKTTGQHMTHYVIEQGPFARSFAKLQASGFAIRWQSIPRTTEQTIKQASKTKYTCPNCEANAWAKPESRLICGTCHEDEGEIFLMEGEI